MLRTDFIEAGDRLNLVLRYFFVLKVVKKSET